MDRWTEVLTRALEVGVLALAAFVLILLLMTIACEMPARRRTREANRKLPRGKE